MQKTVLLTGGLGYIGSHTAIELLNNDFALIIIDDLSNAKIEVLDKIKSVTQKPVDFYMGSILDIKLMESIFQAHNIFAVMHFAAKKSVEESVQQPQTYYETNVVGLINICQMMEKYQCKNLIYSSSATVYGNNPQMPLREDSELQPANPYGNTKLIGELLLKDLCAADTDYHVTALRYFNPGGAHESYAIGDDPNGIPRNLIPYIMQSVAGQQPNLTVNGINYQTADGTCVRDYVHVMDIARGHVRALQTQHGYRVYNLGSGQGHSVLEIIAAFQTANNIKVDYQIGPRRAGDSDCSYADITKASKELNWQPSKTVLDICKDSWEYFKKNKITE